MSDALSPDQTDALKEIMNIAMGQAGDSLARVLDSFITLSIPTSRLIHSTEIAQCLRELVDHSPEISAVRQSFNEDLRGEAIVIFSSGSCSALSDLMGYENNIDPHTEREMLLDISNILIGACLNGVAQQLNAELSFSAPTIIAEKVPPDHLMQASNIHWKSALWLSVDFCIEQRNFKTHLLIMMTDEALTNLCKSINEFMDAI